MGGRQGSAAKTEGIKQMEKSVQKVMRPKEEGAAEGSMITT